MDAAEKAPSGNAALQWYLETQVKVVVFLEECCISDVFGSFNEKCDVNPVVILAKGPCL